MTLRISAISDTHGSLPVMDMIPPCDVLLLAGDICPCRGKSPATIPIQADWLNGRFRNWLNQLKQRNIRVLATPGNHDFIFQQYPEMVSKEVKDVFYIDRGAEIQGMKFWLSPWQVTFGNWAYNLDEQSLAMRWALIPDDTNVLVVHGPPRGYLDNTDIEPKGHFGSYTLTNRMHQLKHLQLMVFGHLHNSGGQELETNNLILANVSYLDDEYMPWAKPIKTWEI